MQKANKKQVKPKRAYYEIPELQSTIHPVFVLNSYHNDLKKRWYIRYTLYHADGSKSHQKWHGGINRYRDAASRCAYARDCIAMFQSRVVLIEPLSLSEKEKHHRAMLLKDSPLSRLLLGAHEAIAPTLRAKSRDTYASKLRIFLAYAAQHEIFTLAALTPEVANTFLNSLLTDKKRKNATYNAYKITLDRYFNYLKLPSPFKGIKRLARQSVPALYFQRFQIQVLKNKLSSEAPQLWDFCQFIYFTLIRPGELRTLRIGDIDFDTARILIVPENAKNKRLEYVSIPDQLFSEIMARRWYELPHTYFIFGREGMPSENQTSRDYFARWHATILKDLRMSTTKYKLYSWKHTGAVAMVREGIHIKYIQMQGRWKSLDQVNDYLRSLGTVDSGDLKSKHVL